MSDGSDVSLLSLEVSFSFGNLQGVVDVVQVKQWGGARNHMV